MLLKAVLDLHLLTRRLSAKARPSAAEPYGPYIHYARTFRTLFVRATTGSIVDNLSLTLSALLLIVARAYYDAESLYDGVQ